MAPCTYVGLALSVNPSGRISFESLEFANIDGPAPVNGLLPGQALRFGDLEFIANHMAQLCLREGNMAMPHISMLDHGPAHAGPMIIDPNALACRIDAYLGANPELELSQHVFYVLANAFAQLSVHGH
jgi:hypothetical protein